MGMCCTGICDVCEIGYAAGESTKASLGRVKCTYRDVVLVERKFVELNVLNVRLTFHRHQQVLREKIVIFVLVFDVLRCDGKHVRYFNQ